MDNGLLKKEDQNWVILFFFFSKILTQAYNFNNETSIIISKLERWLMFILNGPKIV